MSVLCPTHPFESYTNLSFCRKSNKIDWWCLSCNGNRYCLIIVKPVYRRLYSCDSYCKRLTLGKIDKTDRQWPLDWLIFTFMVFVSRLTYLRVFKFKHPTPSKFDRIDWLWTAVIWYRSMMDSWCRYMFAFWWNLLIRRVCRRLLSWKLTSVQ